MKRGLNRRDHSQGFSLIEVLVVMLILGVLLGAVFSEMNLVVKRYGTEGAKLDIFQNAREFIDQMTRDIHQAGIPNLRMYDATLLGPPSTNASNAVGLVFISPTSIRFEGDMDGDGSVDAVAYTLDTSTSTAGNQFCPCLKRSQVKKAGGTAPIDQGVSYSTALENVVNTDIISAFDQAGNPVDISAGVTRVSFDPTNNAEKMNSIKTIQINLNVRSEVRAIGNAQRPQIFLTSTAQVNN